jgi:NADPH-dependent curcumin reductase CurA
LTFLPILARPGGFDVCFDNVDGDIMDAAQLSLNQFARVAIRSYIPIYNQPDAPGPRNLWQLVAKNVNIKRFVVSDYRKQFGQGVEELQQWVSEGRIKFEQEVVEGLDNVLSVFLRLFDDSNHKKLMIRIPEDRAL